MLISLIYISKARYQLTLEQLSDLLEQARCRNAALNITGMLIYIECQQEAAPGRFMQVLEGEELTVTALYDKIAADPRHHQVTVVHQAATQRRTFEQWQMGFKAVGYQEYLNASGFTNLEEFFGETTKFSKFNLASNFLKSFYGMI